MQRRFDQTIACFVRIQCAWRGFLVRKSIKHQHFAAMTIQQAWWSWVDYADSQVAAIQIQRRIRGILARRYCQKIISLFEAVTKIQKIWRGYCQSIVFEITREFAISIQKLVRGFLVRKSFSMEKMSAAAVVVQKTWRCFFAQLQYNLDVLDVVCIQCLVRTKAARKVASRRFIAIACLQRAVRCALARRKLQKVQLQREYQLKQNNATIVCQVSLARRRLSYCEALYPDTLIDRSVLYVFGEQGPSCSLDTLSIDPRRRSKVHGVVLCAGKCFYNISRR